MTLLANKRILVVEDDFFIADDMACGLETAGAEVIGPAASAEAATSLIVSDMEIDGAVLDINLGGQVVFPIADLLRDRRVAIVFASSCDPSDIPTRFAGVQLCAKPASAAAVAHALVGNQLGRAGVEGSRRGEPGAGAGRWRSRSEM